ncbi:hypothetical protein O6H91_16G058900 [Diphasiastrum complanatum]|uniref:Uncharacterized protein n=1 Tax=Diphasiastrum complanatum TaxID=34168 RepID=A0ACC2BCR7_DIPCM|nr:hypothetical protein O6H91_Y010400 [Diphasiastrum complanatum]KAJ7527513.1 hypothetical protein O6H91_16G058900 [Diphasiastrum complanatum]
MGFSYAEQRTGISDGNQIRKRISSWKSFQTSMKRYLHKLSPVPLLSKVTDCYVNSVSVAASHINDGSLIHGPHMGSLQHSASRGLYREEDDLIRMTRTLSNKDVPLPRSASYAGTPIKVDSSNWGRSRSHASVYVRSSDLNTSRRAPLIPKTVLSVTYEE